MFLQSLSLIDIPYLPLSLRFSVIKNMELMNKLVLCTNAFFIEWSGFKWYSLEAASHLNSPVIVWIIKLLHLEQIDTITVVISSQKRLRTRIAQLVSYRIKAHLAEFCGIVYRASALFESLTFVHLIFNQTTTKGFRMNSVKHGKSCNTEWCASIDGKDFCKGKLLTFSRILKGL